MVTRQVMVDYDDFYDDLTDDDIDEIILSVLDGGGSRGTSFEDDYYDDLLDEYVDDVDLLDILGDYDLENKPRVRPIAPPVQPIAPVQPTLTPAGPRPAPPYQHPVAPVAPAYPGFHNPVAGVPPGTSLQFFHRTNFNPYYPTPTPFHAQTFGNVAPVTPGPFSPVAPVTPASYNGVPPVTPFGHTSPAPFHGPPPVTPSPFHRPTPTPNPWSYNHPRPIREPYFDKYHHDKYHFDKYLHNKYYHDKYHHRRPVEHETHFHIHGRPKKKYPPPRPPPTPTPVVEIHHHHPPRPPPTPTPVVQVINHQEKPEPPLRLKQEFYHYTTLTPKPVIYSTPTPKPFLYTTPRPKTYIRFTTRPPRNYYPYEQTLRSRPPLYPIKPKPYYEYNNDQYDYEYYDGQDYPELRFNPQKAEFYSTTPTPLVKTYSTPVTPEPFYTTTVAPWFARPRPHHQPPPDGIHYEPYDPYPHPHSRYPFGNPSDQRLA